MSAGDATPEPRYAHAQNLDRITARFAAIAEDADREGRGDELMADFIREIAADAAAAAYLELARRADVLAATTEPAERRRLEESIRIFPALSGCSFATMIGRCSNDVTEDVRRRIEIIAARAYDARLAELVATVREEGRA